LEYLKRGKRLTPLNGKKSINEDWPNSNHTKNEIETYISRGLNLGWVLDKGDLVIDIDPKNGGVEGYKNLIADLEEKFTFTVSTPSGGRHIYLKIPGECKDWKLKKTLKDRYPGVDFLSCGAYCLIPGSDTNGVEYSFIDPLEGFYQQDAPIKLLEILRKNIVETIDDDLLSNMSFSNVSEDKVKDLLSKLDASMGNDEWVTVGMALHDWDNVLGLELWEDWSKSGQNYDEGETAKRWKSFDHGQGVSLGSLFYLAKDADYANSESEINKLLEEINRATKKDIELSIAPKIQKIKLTPLDRDKLANAIQKRIKDLEGFKLSIVAVRDMISSNKSSAQSNIPDWCASWIYVDSHSKYLNLDTMCFSDVNGFNTRNGHRIPFNESGSKPKASTFVADYGYIRTADAISYLPDKKDTFITIDGKDVVNIYNHEAVPKPSESFTDGGLAAIEKTKKHIELLLGDKEHQEILIQWIAHQVQYPGRQILWAPVIQGTYGSGKTFFSELLSLCLGDLNVGVVLPSQVSSSFNGWCANKLVNILEEIRVAGKNRHDVINALKPLITDRRIQINDKGISQYNTINTTNYICFTNHKDAIPIDKDDRRWWIIYSKFQSKEDLERLGDGYFPDLFNDLRKYAPELKKWLLEYKISEDFIKTKRAPMTKHKESMAALEDSNIEGLAEVRDLLENGGQYYTKECVSSSDLFLALELKCTDIHLNSKNKNYILKKLGFSTLGNMKIDGKTRTIWSKNTMSNVQVREYFSRARTAPAGDLL
jgi:hypothetical protein